MMFLPNFKATLQIFVDISLTIQNVNFMCLKKNQRITVVIRIHPLETMNICTKFHAIRFQSGPKW